MEDQGCTWVAVGCGQVGVRWELTEVCKWRQSNGSVRGGPQPHADVPQRMEARQGAVGAKLAIQGYEGKV
jgi:hypothetical protein